MAARFLSEQELSTRRNADLRITPSLFGIKSTRSPNTFVIPNRDMAARYTLRVARPVFLNDACSRQTRLNKTVPAAPFTWLERRSSIIVTCLAIFQPLTAARFTHHRMCQWSTARLLIIRRNPAKAQASTLEAGKLQTRSLSIIVITTTSRAAE